MNDEQFELEYDLDQILSEFTDSPVQKKAPPAESRREVPADATRVNLMPAGREEQTTVFTPTQNRPASASRRRPPERNRDSLSKPSSPPRNDSPDMRRVSKRSRSVSGPYRKRKSVSGKLLPMSCPAGSFQPSECL